VYVDSGSSDGSLERVRALGILGIALDPARPFTMGRGRNEGFAHLKSLLPSGGYVQFVDGDCELDPDWLATATRLLDQRPELCAVTGYLREMQPEASVYNRLFDIECRGPRGDIPACGGNAMYRADAFARAGGFNETLIAGEEADLCFRLKEQGGVIWRAADRMARHDADMHTFRQWWTRSIRTGHAYAESFALYGRRHPRFGRRSLSSLLYGIALPAGGVAAVLAGGFFPLGRAVQAAGLAVPLAGWVKVGFSGYASRRRLGDGVSDAALFGAACVITKTPEAFGVIKYATNRLRRRATPLIEYRPLAARGKNGSGQR
jgi:glycosyltransferase involved in cell wall biosynthesis